MSKKIYDQSNLNPKGTPEDKTRCIETVNPAQYWHLYQCSRKRGYGPNGEYCKQHAKKLVEREAWKKRFTSCGEKGE
jgi:hypothetical protein